MLTGVKKPNTCMELQSVKHTMNGVMGDPHHNILWVLFDKALLLIEPGPVSRGPNDRDLGAGCEEEALGK